MFVSSGQFVYFSECLFIGVVLGLIYLVFELIGGLIGVSTIKTILDVCFIVPCFFVYRFLAMKLCFPDFRPWEPSSPASVTAAGTSMRPISL